MHNCSSANRNAPVNLVGLQLFQLEHNHLICQKILHTKNIFEYVTLILINFNFVNLCFAQVILLYFHITYNIIFKISLALRFIIDAMILVSVTDDH